VALELSSTSTCVDFKYLIATRNLISTHATFQKKLHCVFLKRNQMNCNNKNRDLSKSNQEYNLLRNNLFIGQNRSLILVVTCQLPIPNRLTKAFKNFVRKCKKYSPTDIRYIEGCTLEGSLISCKRKNF